MRQLRGELEFGSTPRATDAILTYVSVRDENMLDLLDGLKAELMRLKADLATDPRARKIAQIEALLKDYYGIAPTAQDAPKTKADLTRKSERKAKGLPPKRKQIETEILAIIDKSGSVHRSALTWHLVQIGLVGTQRNPQRAVDVYLAQLKDVTSDGKGNWTRKSPEDSDSS